MAEYYLNAMTELPYIIILGPGDVSYILLLILLTASFLFFKSNGIHVNSEYIPYTIESLSNLLKSLVDPDINNHGTINVTLIYPSSIYSSILCIHISVVCPFIYSIHSYARYLSINLSIHPFTILSLFILCYLSIHLSMYASIFITTYLFIHPYIYLCIHYLSVHPLLASQSCILFCLYLQSLHPLERVSPFHLLIYQL